MDPRAPAEIDAEERATLFHEQYGNESDPGVTLAEIVAAAGDYITRIVGQADVDAAMARLVEGVVDASGGTVADPGAWRAALSRATPYCFSEWELGNRLHDLAAYGRYGIVLHNSDDPKVLAKVIEDAVTEAERFIQATPVAEWGINLSSDLHRVVRLASNRWALDNGQDVEPAALAELGGVTEGRVRNMMSGANRTFNPNDGRIPAHEALAWLAKRHGFWNSIWREQRLALPYANKQQRVERPVFVPISRDGSAFHPGLRRGGTYTIGEKGSEVHLESFEDALAELQRMPVAYWRRPNAAGNWGILSGVRWARLDATDLEALADNPKHKILDAGRV